MCPRWPNGPWIRSVSGSRWFRESLKSSEVRTEFVSATGAFNLSLRAVGDGVLRRFRLAFTPEDAPNCAMWRHYARGVPVMGRSMVNRAPWPGPSLSALIRPPWASTSARVIVRPMPLPLWRRLRARSAW